MNILLLVSCKNVNDIIIKLKELSSVSPDVNIYVSSWSLTHIDLQECKPYLNGGDIVYPPTLDRLSSEFINTKYVFDEHDLESSSMFIKMSSHDRWSDETELSFVVNNVAIGVDVYNYWIDFFDRKSIDFIYSANQEHSPIDGLLFKAAKNKNVKKIFFRRGLGLNDEGMFRFFICNMFTEKAVPIAKFSDSKTDVSITESRMFVDWGLGSLKNPSRNLLPFKKIKQISYKTFDYFIVKRTALHQTLLMMSYRFVNSSFIFFRRLKSLNDHYQSLLNKDYNLDGKYILYCMHFEPESSIYPVDSIRSYQLYNLKLLSSCLPEGWKIFVKEHPSQLKKGPYLVSINYRKLLFRYRNNRFYDYIDSLDNASIIDSNKFSSHELIKKSAAVASNNGTVFLEASVNNKPCISFGIHGLVSFFSNVRNIKDRQSCLSALEFVSKSEGVSKSDYATVMSEYTIHEPDSNHELDALINYATNTHNS